MTRGRISARQLASLVLGFGTPSAWAADAIQVGGIQVDRPTLCCVGIVVPVSGDDNFNARALVDYRTSAASAWSPALPLLRVRPDTLGEETPPGDYGLPDPAPEFAGSIFGLPAGQSVEVRVSVTDPDGGSSVQTITAATRSSPLLEPAQPNVVPVATSSSLANAVANAQPGDVITLSPGSYSGPVTISRSGIASAPIVLRGSGTDNTTIDASGASYGLTISGSHVYVEDLTVRGSDWGARLSGSQNIVVRRSRFTDVNKGIDARNGSKRDFYLCDNVIEGRIAWPDVSNATWDQEGIVVTGEGHVVCHNRLSGFGDALGLSQNTSIPNRSIDFYRNDVRWTGDDGLEIDYAHRNIRVFENRVANSGMGVSVQPVWGGPIYILRNVLVNQAAAPYKFNNDPTGLLVLNNTSIRTNGPGNYEGAAWPQLGYEQADGEWSYVANFQFLNNVVVGKTGPAKFTSAIQLGTLDYNGWFPDGPFVLFESFSNFADVQARSPHEQHGRVLTAPILDAGPSLGADYTTLVTDPDVTLASNSNAIDAGTVLANVTDGYTGSGPDLGAYERGVFRPVYGVRSTATVPSPPKNLVVE